MAKKILQKKPTKKTKSKIKNPKNLFEFLGLKDVKPEGYIFGRPTKYNSAFATEAVRYATANPPYKSYSSMFGIKEVPCNIPTVEAFAVKLGVAKSTVYKWAQEHKDFSDALDMIREAQRIIYIENGLRGNYQGSLAVFIGKNVIGYKDNPQPDMKDKLREVVDAIREAAQE